MSAFITPNAVLGGTEYRLDTETRRFYEDKEWVQLDEDGYDRAVSAITYDNVFACAKLFRKYSY